MQDTQRKEELLSELLQMLEDNKNGVAHDLE
jgi:hypothetical protein